MKKTFSNLGLALPIKSGPFGYFNQSTSTVSQTKYNIENLLKTKRGERRFQPLFGSSIDKHIFDPNTDMLTEVIKRSIIEDISRWLPAVSINFIETTLTKNELNNNIDSYKLYIVINFSIGQETDQLDFYITNSK